MKALIPFTTGDYAINGFKQQVKIVDICGDDVIFTWIEQDCIDILSTDEFDELFKPIKNTQEQKPPLKRNDYQ